MNENQYISRIRQLEKEISYLHGLLDEAGISYRKEAKIVEDLSPDKNILFDDNQGAIISPLEITKHRIKFFRNLFNGRSDVYCLRYGKVNKKTGKHSYYTQCWYFWKDGLCPKRNNPKFSCGECKNPNYKELTDEVVYEHLRGKKEDASDVLGVYPLLLDETINFLVFDFDCHNDDVCGDDWANPDSEWMIEVNTFRKICEDNDVPILVERSRSGKGAHFWIFFEKPILASTARRFGTALLTKGAESVNMKKFTYYDRMLPAQDHIPINAKTGRSGLGNLIALPLQGLALQAGNSAFIDENWNAYPDQWECLKNVKRISKEIVEEKIKVWGADGLLGGLCNDFDEDADDTMARKQKPWEKVKLSFCKEDAPSVVEIIISDKIYINSKGMQYKMQNAIRRMAAFSNSEFCKTAGMGFSTQGMSRIISCGYDDGDYICIPRALLDSLIEKLNASGIPFSLTDN